MTATTSGDRVLIVEDEPTTRLGLTELVNTWGFATDSAADGQEALQKITAFRPSIIISDLVMPRMGGLELLRALKDEGNAMTVVILTAEETGPTVNPSSPSGLWDLGRFLVEHVRTVWTEPDEGIWEVRGPRRHFVHSKVMAWAAVDRAVRGVEEFGLEGPVDDWKRLRGDIADEVCTRGFDSRRGTFTQFYGSRELDAALLLIPAVGFLPATDERVTGTVDAIERDLCRDGFVRRYTTTKKTQQLDGLPPGEGAFLPCTFWLADAYLLAGRRRDGEAVFERLLRLRNDVGLLAEEYDVDARRMVGNFPQALSHLALVNTAFDLASDAGPSHRRGAT